MLKNVFVAFTNQLNFILWRSATGLFFDDVEAEGSLGAKALVSYDFGNLKLDDLKNGSGVSSFLSIKSTP